MQDRYATCVGMINLLHLSCNGHETFDQLSFCVRAWGCDFCMLLSGHLCSFPMGWLYTPCNIMVLLRLGTNMVAWTGCVIQCTMTACTLLWLVPIRNTADSFGGSMLFKLGRGSTRPVVDVQGMSLALRLCCGTVVTKYGWVLSLLIGAAQMEHVQGMSLALRLCCGTVVTK